MLDLGDPSFRSHSRLQLINYLNNVSAQGIDVEQVALSDALDCSAVRVAHMSHKRQLYRLLLGIFAEKHACSNKKRRVV